MLAGREGYEIESGQVLFDKMDISSMSADERAKSGLFSFSVSS